MRSTEDFYDHHAETYVAHGRVNPHLGQLLARLAAGAHILELGTGSGRDAKAMLDAGFRVDATDGSPALARQAELLLGQKVRHLRFEALDAVGHYDAIYAAASLLHAAPEMLPDIIARIHCALKPGGWVWASFKHGDAPGFDRHQRFYNYMNAGQLAQYWQQAAAWRQLQLNSWQGGAYDNEPTQWHAILAQR